MRQLTAKDFCEVADSLKIQSGGLYTLQEMVYELAMLCSEIPAEDFYELSGFKEYTDATQEQMAGEGITVSETPDGWLFAPPEPILRAPRDSIASLGLRHPKARDVMRMRGRPTRYSVAPWDNIWMVKELSEGVLRVEDVEAMPIGLFAAIKAELDDYKAVNFGLIGRA